MVETIAEKHDTRPGPAGVTPCSRPAHTLTPNAILRVNRAYWWTLEQALSCLTGCADAKCTAQLAEICGALHASPASRRRLALEI